MDDLIIGIIVGIIIGFVSGVLSAIVVMVIQRRWEKSDKSKEQVKDSLKKHKKEVVAILKKIENTKIRCDGFNLWRDGDFKVWIEDLEELEGEKIYKQAIQHLEAYPDIYEPWDNSIKKIDGNKDNKVDGLNDELIELKKYLSRKISDKFEAEQDKLHSSIWCIIEGAKPSERIKDSKDLDEFFDGVNITIKGKTVYLDSSDGNNLALVSCRVVNVNDVTNFLSDLIKKDKDNNFREKVRSFMMGYKELKETFADFKNKFNGLLQDVEGEEDNLKGECDKCSSWMKEIDHRFDGG